MGRGCGTERSERPGLEDIEEDCMEGGAEGIVHIVYTQLYSYIQSGSTNLAILGTENCCPELVIH